MRRDPRLVRLGVLLFAALLLAGTVLPLCGLGLGLLQGAPLARALDVVQRTALNTLLYAGGAGVVALVLGFGLAFSIGRDVGLRRLAVAFSIVIFSLPPALAALGIVGLAAEAPAWTDPFFRSRGTVCVALGLRFSPVAVLLGLRGWGTMPPSWALAAAVHGVPPSTYLFRVILPHLLPGAAATVLVVFFLATADVSTVLLLQPPGESSFPLSIFTVMANAPEALVASLCVLYIAGAAVVITLAWLCLEAVRRVGRHLHSGGEPS